MLQGLDYDILVVHLRQTGFQGFIDIADGGPQQGHFLYLPVQVGFDLLLDGLIIGVLDLGLYS